MNAQAALKRIDSFEQCISWAEADANRGTQLTDQQLASLRELWDKGTCFSLIHMEKETERYTEALITPVPTHPGEFMLISRDVTTTYAELVPLKL